MEGAPISPGTFVAVAGASGVGKDTLLRYAAARLSGDPRFVFVRRSITRPAGDGSEDHLGVTEAAFTTQAASGAFAVTWTAHGLSYGLPLTIDAEITAGRIVIANVSRTIVGALQRRYPKLLRIRVTAPSASVAARLRQRGRESPDEIVERTSRSIVDTDAGWIELPNDGAVAEAGDRLVTLLLALPAG
ncbi:MAG: phosphonate metabolism protein/1,5-bisphosphokinase (PRPP-forming) PhnN [Devosia sp.]